MSVQVNLHGFQQEEQANCPKCDAALFAQGDGSVLTEDIAHQGETVPEAMDKLDRLLDRAWAGYASGLRLIVGGGLIRDEVHSRLFFLQREGRIRGWEEEGRNQGAVLIRLRE